jgi:hypothetical protein
VTKKVVGVFVRFSAPLQLLIYHFFSYFVYWFNDGVVGTALLQEICQRVKSDRRIKEE